MNEPAPGAAPAGAARARIIDVNVEIGPIPNAAGMLTADDVLNAHARSGIGHSLVRTATAVRVNDSYGNRQLLERLESEPDLSPIAAISPVGLEAAATHLPDVVRRGAKAVWVEGRDAWSVGSEAAQLSLEIAAATGLPLLVPHRVWGDASAIGRMTASLGVPVILAGAHYMVFADVLAAVRRYPHLHLETSALGGYRAVEDALRAVGRERLLFGSGGPSHSPLSPLFAVLLAQIGDADREAIFSGNARRVFDVRGAEPRTIAQPCIGPRIFDVHEHTFPAPWQVPQPTPAELAAEVARFGIQRRVASSIAAMRGDLEAGNRDLVEACRSVPGQYGYLMADANDLAATREHARRWGDSEGIVGFKIHTVHSGVPTTSPLMRALFEDLAAIGRPVKIHNSGAGWEDALLDLARRHPHLPIIVAHAGPGRAQASMADLVMATDNVYLELASSTPDIREVRALVAGMDPQRLLFGSDAPLIDPAFVLGTYQDSGLSAATLDAVFWENAVRLFGDTAA